MYANWLSVLVAAASAFMVGGLWYGALFEKPWMRANGLTEAQIKQGNPLKIYGTSFLLSIVSAFFLGHLLAFFNPEPKQIMMISSGIAMGFIIPSIGISYLFSHRTGKLFLIDAGYWLAFYTVMGGVFVLLGV